MVNVITNISVCFELAPTFGLVHVLHLRIAIVQVEKKTGNKENAEIG